MFSCIEINNPKNGVWRGDDIAIPIIDYFMEGCYQQGLNLVVNHLRLKFVGIALE